MSLYFPDTIVAPATALAESAVGVVRLSGPLAFEIARKIFRSRRSSSISPKPRQIYLGELFHPISGEVFDEALMVMMKSPASYTGEDVVELHTHGSPVILSVVLSLAMAQGARLAVHGEFTKRAFLNGKMDLSQAEAVADLIGAKSLQAAQNAVRQLGGFLEKYVTEIRELLLSVLVRLEVGFDFSEEDVSFITHDEVKSALLHVSEKVLSLLGTYETGRCLVSGFKIAIVGRPNVGKSSVFNLLLREDRAIVHSQAGTTRDVIEGEIVLAGCRVILMDTAGLRVTKDEIETEGIKRARAKMESADYLLVVLDGSQPLSSEDISLLEDTKNLKRVIILNKSDLPQIISATDLKKRFDLSKYVMISAINEFSIHELEGFLTSHLQENVTNNVQNYVLTKERHRFILDRASAEVQNIVQNIEHKNCQDDVLSDEIRRLSSGLDEIGGSVSSEEVLDQIFRQFCIGK